MDQVKLLPLTEYGVGIGSFAVLPEFQRMGAGRAFMTWGLDRADAEGSLVSAFLRLISYIDQA